MTKQFILADSFLDSQAALDPQDMAIVLDAVRKFRHSPDHPSLSFHRLSNIQEPNFWSARANDDLRMIIYQDGSHTVLCYVDHHDAAYEWAKRRKLDINAFTGAAQLIVIKERTEEVVRQIHKLETPGIFAEYDDEYLLKLGVPEEWLEPVKKADEDHFLQISDYLPNEVGEVLMRLLEGLPVAIPDAISGDPFLHPDAQRRFRVVHDDLILEQALSAPREKWAVFLHPAQQEIVDRKYNGPARVTGGAGTGKTVVALHRAVRLARDNPGSTVLLTTYTKTLAARLKQSLCHLVSSADPTFQRIDVRHLHSVAVEAWKARTGETFNPLQDEALDEVLTKAMAKVGPVSLSATFLRLEWNTVVDAEGITTWEEYRSFRRVGRGVALGAKQRLEAWKVFSEVQRMLDGMQLKSYERVCHEAALALKGASDGPYDFVVADEVQDFGPTELRFLGAITGDKPDALFLAGDLAQRIYKGKTSFLGAGIDLRGNSHTLRVNYRTTEQIRRYADRLIPERIADADGVEELRDAVSLLRGPEPRIVRAKNMNDEIEQVSTWLKNLISTQGISPTDVAIFTRSNFLGKQRAQPVVTKCGLQSQQLSDNKVPELRKVSIGTMHRAKGLEFKVVIVMGCEEQYLPSRNVLAKFEDPVERELYVEQERNLFYVACTRAREHLLVSYAGNPSPFIKG